MATLTIQTINDAGSVPTFSAATESGDQYLNTGNQFLAIKNAGTESACVVTITAQVTSLDLTLYGEVTKASTTLSVAAGSTGFIGGLYTPIFNDASGYAQITYSQVESVTIAALINKTQI
jgi:hypothetical protein